MRYNFIFFVTLQLVDICLAFLFIYLVLLTSCNSLSNCVMPEFKWIKSVVN
jgi:hypothetical protein